MKTRGNNNLAYKQGFKIELEKFKEYKSILKETLQADQIELTTRGLLDKATGIDATALIDGLIYGISLRFRSSDYNSFTLNRHETDPYSEVHKWTAPNNGNLKPHYYIQLNKCLNNQLRLIKINIDAFAYVLTKLREQDRLNDYFNPKLLAYEFPLKGIEYTGIHNKVFTQYTIV